jgi:hypothetical protein
LHRPLASEPLARTRVDASSSDVMNTDFMNSI